MRTTLATLCLVIAVGCSSSGSGGSAAVAPARKVWDREDLKKAVLGKTTNEVKALLGTPDQTSEAGDAKYWVYNHISRDATTGKTDESTVLYFHDGRTVSKVSY